MLRGHPQRGIYRSMRVLGVPSVVNSAAVTASMSARRLKQSDKSNITSGRHRERAEVVDADGYAGSFWQGQRDGGPPDRLPRRFACSTLQAVAQPPPGADAHANPSTKTCGNTQGASGAQVARSCGMASLHDSGAHEQRYIHANRLVVQKAGRTTDRALRVRRKGGRRPSDE